MEKHEVNNWKLLSSTAGNWTDELSKLGDKKKYILRSFGGNVVPSSSFNWKHISSLGLSAYLFCYDIKLFWYRITALRKCWKRKNLCRNKLSLVLDWRCHAGTKSIIVASPCGFKFNPRCQKYDSFIKIVLLFYSSVDFFSYISFFQHHFSLSWLF